MCLGGREEGNCSMGCWSGTLHSALCNKQGFALSKTRKKSSLGTPDAPQAGIPALENTKHQSKAGDDRIMESFRSEKTLKIIKSNHPPPLTRVSRCHIYTSFKSHQGCGLHLCPGQPVPVLDRPFGEDVFLNIQSKPPLAQLEAIRLEML
ncbi:hypothetical protein BTVI_126129 [Pitangus sulphuratus]|nr:hypothetical protein BTVI_126129 [Pitangus sulphuratus]